MNLSAFTDRLIAARRTQGRIGPGTDEPQSLTEAYDVQCQLCEKMDETIAGWKIAVHPVLGVIAAPIFSRVCIAENHIWPMAQGPGVEIEIALWLDRDLPPGKYGVNEIAAAVSGCCTGVEFVTHRLAEPERNLFAFLGDCMANAGYVSAAQRAPWRMPELAGKNCRLHIAGATIYDAPIIAQPLAPLELVAAWLEKENDARKGFKAGQFITTGSLCGVIPVAAKGDTVAEIEGFGAVGFSLV